MIRWIWWVVLASACPASEIISFNVPISRYLYRGMETDGMVRLKSAPEPSPFFKEGDELWDLKGVAAENRMENPPEVTWLVWNASSGKLIAKAEWISIWQLHRRLGIDNQPRRCRITASLYEVASDGAPPSDAKTPCQRLTWVARSGLKFDAAHKSELGCISMSGVVSLDEHQPLAGLKLRISHSPPDQPKMDFHSSVSMWSGTSLWLARDFDGKTGLDIMISQRIEQIDGTPVEQTIMMQNGDRAEPLKLDHTHMSRHRIGERSWLAVQGIDPIELLNWNVADVPESDPFSDKEPDEIKQSLKLEEVRVPLKIQAWFSGPVWNIQGLIRSTGSISDESPSFVGYDPRSRCIILFTDDVGEMDRLEQLFSLGCFRSPKHVEVSLDGRGQSRLITLSGCRSGLSRKNGDNQSIRNLEIEPVIGEADDLVGIGLDYRDETEESAFKRIQSHVTLRSGQSVNVLEALSGRNAETTLRLKAEIKEAAR